MRHDGGELSFRTWLQPKRLWLTVPVEIGGRLTLDMVLDTGSPASGLSARSWSALTARGLLDPSGSRWHTLRQLAIEGQAIPDLAVRVSPRATELGADGIPGADVLRAVSTDNLRCADDAHDTDARISVGSAPDHSAWGIRIAIERPNS